MATLLLNPERNFSINTHHSNERGLMITTWDEHQKSSPERFRRHQMPEVDLVLRVLQIR